MNLNKWKHLFGRTKWHDEFLLDLPRNSKHVYHLVNFLVYDMFYPIRLLFINLHKAEFD